MLLDIVSEEVLTKVKETYSATKAIVPRLSIALGVLIVGYFISLFLGFVTRKIVARFNLDRRLRRVDLNDTLGRVSMAKFFGIWVKWVVFFLFLVLSLTVISAGGVAFVDPMIVWIPKLVFGISIVVFGLLLIDFITYKILDIEWKYTGAVVKFTKFFLIIVVVFTALEQIGIGFTFLKQFFLMIFGAVMLCLSLVIGIGLGFGLKDETKRILKRIRKKKKR